MVKSPYSDDYEPKDIRELLIRTVDTVDEDNAPAYKIGNGASANGYSFGDNIPGLERYVLRVNRSILRNQSMEQLLTSHTSLTPINKLLCNVHAGQALASVGNAITIHLRQEGVSLQELARQQVHNRHGDDPKLTIARKKEIRSEALCNVIDHVLADYEKGAENPFIRVMEDAYQLVKAGREPDFKINNILFDEARHQLGLVDQTTTPISAYYLNDRYTPEQHLDNEIKQMIDDMKSFVVSQHVVNIPYYGGCFLRLEDALQEAKNHVIAAHAKDDPNAPAKVSFKNVTDVAAISLNEPPHVLVKLLQDIEKRAEIPAR